jgi:hypothetical protein
LLLLSVLQRQQLVAFAPPLPASFPSLLSPLLLSLLAALFVRGRLPSYRGVAVLLLLLFVSSVRQLARLPPLLLL